MGKKNRRKRRDGGGREVPFESPVIPREEALRRISDVLRDRTAYVMPVHPGADITPFLAELQSWAIYIEHPYMDTILVLTSDHAEPEAFDMMNTLVPGPLTAVVTFSKCVANRQVMERRHGSLSDEQDIVLPQVEELVSEGMRFALPLLFVDAVDVYDPIAAATFRAQWNWRDASELS